jgi:hypothetical protein
MPIHSLVISCGYAESQSFAQIVATYSPGASTKEEIIEKFTETVKRYLVHLATNDKKSCCIKQGKNKENTFCSKCGLHLGPNSYDPNEAEINEFVSLLYGEDIDTFGCENADFFENEGWCFWQGVTLGHVVEVSSWDYPKVRTVTEYWVGPIPESC